MNEKMKGLIALAMLIAPLIVIYRAWKRGTAPYDERPPEVIEMYRCTDCNYQAEKYEFQSNQWHLLERDQCPCCNSTKLEDYYTLETA